MVSCGSSYLPYTSRLRALRGYCLCLEDRQIIQSPSSSEMHPLSTLSKTSSNIYPISSSLPSLSIALNSTLHYMFIQYFLDYIPRLANILFPFRQQFLMSSYYVLDAALSLQDKWMHLGKFLELTIHSVNICWINKWMNFLWIPLEQNFSSYFIKLLYLLLSILRVQQYPMKVSIHWVLAFGRHSSWEVF